MMEIKFDAYHYDELILASKFLLDLAQLQQKRMQVDREAKSAENMYAKQINNLDQSPPPGFTPPGAGPGAVLGGIRHYEGPTGYKDE